MSQFIFKSYDFDKKNSMANFLYEFDDGRTFKESVTFESGDEYNNEALERALFLAFVLIGTSYYKTFPTVNVKLDIPIDEWQATFFDKVYQEGLSQFAFENGLTRDNLAHFKAGCLIINTPVNYAGCGILALQSGGKDSLLTASLLQEKGREFTSWYVSSGDDYPDVLNETSSKLVISKRLIDRSRLQDALSDGAKNGHVPVTYIIQSLAIIQSILLGKNEILTSIAHEGEEQHANIGDLVVTHQWSKTWQAEKDFAEYVTRYISPDIYIGSPLRCYSELRVAELFVNHSWKKYGNRFSSCNIANYQQGSNNSVLKWCGNCPKCANSYLLFAPFLPADGLKNIFSDQDLFGKLNLEDTFKGLLGIDGISKPFECIGEVDELRLAYGLSRLDGVYRALPFMVPKSSFDYTQTYPAQNWATTMLQ